MNIVLRYGNERAVCRVRESRLVTRRIRIHVYPDARVEIEAPPGQDRDRIKAAAQRRARWVFTHRAAALRARELAIPREYVSGETHFYLGRRYKLVVRRARTLSPVRLVRGRLEVTAPGSDPAAVRRRLKAWYRQRAQEYLAKKLADVVAGLRWMKAAPPVKFASMAAQWGSCSPGGVIRLNPALVKAPRHCIEYVMLHELCHLREHNHSKRFYALLDRHMPAWSTAKAQLDGLAELLLSDR